MTKPPEIVIQSQDAAFRLDRRGRWCNRHGIFRNHRISQYFHAAIRRDAQGYFVCQERESCIEKVYFPYEDTALFVTDVLIEPEISLQLNTRRRLQLDPAQLYVADDSLYLMDGDERIKFTERALMQLSTRLDFTDDGYFIEARGQRCRIRDGGGERP